MSKKSKTTILEEQREKIKQLRAEAIDPSLREARLIKEQDEADRKTAITKQKLEEWMIMKMLKGEWQSHGKELDIDKMAKVCSVYGKMK